MWLTHPSLTLFFFPEENTALQALHVTRGPVLLFFFFLSSFLLALSYHLDSVPVLFVEDPAVILLKNAKGLRECARSVLLRYFTDYDLHNNDFRFRFVS